MRRTTKQFTRRPAQWPRQLTGGLAITLITVVASGCGNGLAQVSGEVTLDGQPLRGGNGVRGTVYFQPLSGAGSAAVGILDASGQYELSTGSQKGIAPGEYAVTCTATQIIPSSTAGGTPRGRLLTPRKYANTRTSGLQHTVQPGGNEIDLQLTTTGNRGG